MMAKPKSWRWYPQPVTGRLMNKRSQRLVVKVAMDTSMIRFVFLEMVLTFASLTTSCEQMNLRLFLSLTAMAFLWVGSQIPLYLFGSVLPLIYSDIGGVDRYVWFVIGYLIPNAALW
jgi:hypothetical protein